MVEYMKITYYNTLYKREVKLFVAGKVEFKNGEAHFSSGGHGYAVPLEYVRKIELEEEDY